MALPQTLQLSRSIGDISTIQSPVQSLSQKNSLVDKEASHLESIVNNEAEKSTHSSIVPTEAQSSTDASVNLPDQPIKDSKDNGDSDHDDRDYHDDRSTTLEAEDNTNSDTASEMDHEDDQTVHIGILPDQPIKDSKDNGDSDHDNRDYHDDRSTTLEAEDNTNSDTASEMDHEDDQTVHMGILPDHAWEERGFAQWQLETLWKTWCRLRYNWLRVRLLSDRCNSCRVDAIDHAIRDAAKQISRGQKRIGSAARILNAIYWSQRPYMHYSISARSLLTFEKALDDFLDQSRVCEKWMKEMYSSSYYC